MNRRCIIYAEKEDRELEQINVGILRELRFYSDNPFSRITSNYILDDSSHSYVNTGSHSYANTGNPTKIYSNTKRVRNHNLGVRITFTKIICSPATFLKQETDNPIKIYCNTEKSIINQIIIQMNLFVIQNEFLFYLSKIFKTDIVNIKMLVAYERNNVYLEKLAICMKKCMSQVNFGPKTIQLKVQKKDLSIYNLFHFMFEKHNIINDIDAIKTAKKAVILCSKLDYNVPKFDNKNIFNSFKMAIKITEEAIRSTEEAINNYIINKQSIKESIANIKNKVICMEKLFQDYIECHKNDDYTCVICLEPMFLQDAVRIQCSHVYHKKCIDKCNKLCCPMCKGPIGNFFYYV
jgi:hypothetical protein